MGVAAEALDGVAPFPPGGGRHNRGGYREFVKTLHNRSGVVGAVRCNLRNSAASCRLFHLPRRPLIIAGGLQPTQPSRPGLHPLVTTHKGNDVKQNNLMKASFAALLLASSMAGAAPTSQEDFKPEILYQDADYIASHKPTALPSASASAQQSTSKQDVAAAPSEKAVSQSGGQLGQNYWLGLVILGLGGLIFWSSKRSGAAEAPAYSAPVAQSGSPELTGVSRYLKAHEGSAGVATAALTGVARYLQNRG